MYKEICYVLFFNMESHRLNSLFKNKICFVLTNVLVRLQQSTVDLGKKWTYVSNDIEEVRVQFHVLTKSFCK